MAPRVAFHTLGCKLNYAETSSIGKSFVDRGYTVVSFRSPAEVVVINTCTVTENADRECRKIIRQARRRSPDACIIVAGCYAELRPHAVASIEGVDLILGSNEKFHIFDQVPELTRRDTPLIRLGSAVREEQFEPAVSRADDARTRAFLKVQDGCDYTCSYCTIPMARGGSRSAERASILDSARRLIDQGFREIILSGVNVGDYGKGREERLVDLLYDLVRLGPRIRYRVSSIEPNLLTDELIALVRECPSLCPHFHIPMQSGSATILRAMKRRYTTHVYRDRIETVKAVLPHCGIGADVIVGFPGETEALFEETYAFIRDLPISYLHVFPFSARPGTPAAQMEECSAAEKSDRVHRLHILSEKLRHAFHESQVGRSVEVLFEQESDGRISGWSENYIRVSAPGQKAEEGNLESVRIIHVSEGQVQGERIASSTNGPGPIPA